MKRLVILTCLLKQWAIEDRDLETRCILLRRLAAQNPNDTTYAFLTQRAVISLSDKERGAAFAAIGNVHSKFGRIVPSRDLDGEAPYLDPFDPIPREQIERAAAVAGIRPQEIDSQVASLSAHLGWDVTRGAKAR